MAIQEKFADEKSAIVRAKELEKTEEYAAVIYSPHKSNPNKPYWVEAGKDHCPFIRGWETLVYETK